MHLRRIHHLQDHLAQDPVQEAFHRTVHQIVRQDHRGQDPVHREDTHPEDIHREDTHQVDTHRVEDKCNELIFNNRARIKTINLWNCQT